MEKIKTAEEINAELAKLFESDVKEFSINGAKAFGHILAKYGIADSQKWFEEKLKRNVYSEVSPYVHTRQGLAIYCDGLGNIHFNSLDGACKFIRAHEMVHRITLALTDTGAAGQVDSVQRFGLSIANMKIVENEKTGKLEKIHSAGSKFGWDFNEGVTNLIAEKLSGFRHSRQTLYGYQTRIARQMREIVGEDAIFESAFFNPNILEDKWSKLTGDKCSYLKILYSLDESRKIQFDAAMAEGAERKSLLKQFDKASNAAMSEVLKYTPIAKKAKYFAEIVYRKVFIANRFTAFILASKSSKEAKRGVEQNIKTVTIQPDKIERTSMREVLKNAHWESKSKTNNNEIRLNDNPLNQ